MVFFYHILSTLASLVVAPCFAFIALLSKYKMGGLAHHYGFVPAPEKNQRKILWVYALSLGEVNAALPVLKQLHQDRPELSIVVSVTTDSGYEGARKHLAFADSIFFHPLDCFPFVQMALDRVDPDLFVLMDTGFWPGFMDLLKRRNIPAILLNGRISKRSARRYKSVLPLMREVFGGFTLLFMQNEHSAESVRQFGVEPGKVRVMDDPKYDSLKSMPGYKREDIKKKLRIPGGKPVWVAGSTREGEEEILLDAYQKLKKEHNGLVLVLAPRRVERVREIEGLMRERKIAFIRRTEIMETSLFNRSVVLLDTVGELAEIYSIGEAAFVGRSLIAPGGGHSLVEPVVHGLAVLHGPFVDNFKDSADELGEAGIAFKVKNTEEIVETLNGLLTDNSRRAHIADGAQAFIESRQGASKKMADIIIESLKT